MTGRMKLQTVKPARFLLLFAILIITSLAHAGDEEFNPSAYQIFDPVTGYFINVDPPPDDQQASQQTPAASIDSQVSASADSIVPESPVAGPAAPDEASGLNPAILTAGLVAFVLVVGFALKKRKENHG
jgi:hypothetical protein